MAEIVDAIEAFGRARQLRGWGGDPGLLAIQNLPSQAGLATRVRTMIDAGSTDEIVDQYIETWIEGAASEPNPRLHRDLAALRDGTLPIGE